MTTTQTAKFPVFTDNTSEMNEFVLHLAAYCNQYVMEIAKPIMERAADLYSDPAIVKLVDLWFEADRQYSHKRQSYLVQWSQYNPDDEYSCEPIDSYKWADEKRQAYRMALDALLVR